MSARLGNFTSTDLERRRSILFVYTLQNKVYNRLCTMGSQRRVQRYVPRCWQTLSTLVDVSSATQQPALEHPIWEDVGGRSILSRRLNMFEDVSGAT